VHAFLRAPDRLWACAAAVVSGLGMVGWGIIMWVVVASFIAGWLA
jgi:hypothetical protein